MNSKRHTNPRGFTIVELLIVIVVIAILAAISFVAYGNIRNRANSSVTKMDLANLETKLKTYQIENNRFPESIEEMQASGFGATEKMNWGYFGGSNEHYTPRGKYLFVTNHQSDGGETFIWYWDYDDGAWWRKEIMYFSNLGWSTVVNYGQSGDPESFDQPCRATVLEECEYIEQ